MAGRFGAKCCFALEIISLRHFFGGDRILEEQEAANISNADSRGRCRCNVHATGIYSKLGGY